MKGTVKLMLLRAMLMAILLALNILMISVLSLDEIGKYYIIAAFAYFGNALFFVGLDFSLQRKIRDISITKSMDLLSLRFCVLKALPYGVAATFLLSVGASLVGGGGNVIEIALLCATLSAINFLTSLSRNILQIAGEKYRVSYSLILEQLLKLFLALAIALLSEATAIAITFAFLLASLAGFLFNYRQIVESFRHENGITNYAIDSNDVFKIILPTGAGGVLNWLQLQAYRPVLGQFLQKTELVGQVSFLTMLGATVASGLLSVLAQVWTPKQFASNGDASRRFVQLAFFLTLGLALLAYPVAYIFLRLLKKGGLYGLEYLVCFGVIIEGCNFILGVLGNHSSLTLRSFVPSMVAGVVGFIAVAVIIYTVYAKQWMGPGMIGFALAASQCIAVAVLLPVLLRKFSGKTIT